MSLKILYQKLDGSLTADISSATTLIPIDLDSLAILQSNVDFDGGEWTYLSLVGDVYTEEVKVVGITTTYLSVVRARSGSTARAFTADATEIFNVVGADAIADIVTQNPTPSSTTIVGSGIATVTNPSTNNYVVEVESPAFSGDSGVTILGSWPNITISYEGYSEGCGCSGSSSSGDGVNTVVVSSSILQASITDTTLSLTLPSPTFSGAGGVTVSGSWADGYTITGSGAGGTGTVTSVSAGTGLTLTGTPSVNPTLAITATGVGAGTYGGFTFNAQGQLTSVTSGYAPVGSIELVNGGSVAASGTDYTITLNTADVGTPGIIELADSAAALDSADDSSAVTPKILAQAIADLGSTVVGAGTSTGEADASYTNVISSTAINIEASSTQKILVLGECQMQGGSGPSTPVEFGVAVFNAANVKLYSSKLADQDKQAFVFLLNGPVSSTTISLVTTAVPGGASVITSELVAVVF